METNKILSKRTAYLLSLLLLVMVSCKKDKSQKVYNPFATPERCVQEYLDAMDANDLHRLMNCYSYDAKYERLLRDELQEQLDKNVEDKYYHSSTYIERTDSVKLKDLYPNTAVVTVYYSWGDNMYKLTHSHYDMNLVKDGDNWKLETEVVVSISSDY